MAFLGNPIEDATVELVFQGNCRFVKGLMKEMSQGPETVL